MRTTSVAEPVAIIDGREVDDIELDALVGAAIGHPGRVEYRACKPDEDAMAFWSGHRGEVSEFVQKYPQYVLKEARVFPRYSSDMGCAWWVVELLTGKLPTLTYQCGIFIGDPERMGWFADFRAVDRAFAAAPTAALGVCLAALLATGKAKEVKARG